MAVQISGACINCGHCRDRCPQQAISRGPDTYVVDPEKCVECGLCVMICPVGAPAVPAGG